MPKFSRLMRCEISTVRRSKIPAAQALPDRRKLKARIIAARVGLGGTSWQIKTVPPLQQPVRVVSIQQMQHALGTI